MGAGILDSVILPTQAKNGNSLATRLHKLAHLQVLKLGSSPNLYKLSHGETSFPGPALFRTTFRRAALGLNSVPPPFRLQLLGLQRARIKPPNSAQGFEHRPD